MLEVKCRKASQYLMLNVFGCYIIYSKAEPCAAGEIPWLIFYCLWVYFTFQHKWCEEKEGEIVTKCDTDRAHWSYHLSLGGSPCHQSAHTKWRQYEVKDCAGCHNTPGTVCGIYCTLSLLFTPLQRDNAMTFYWNRKETVELDFHCGVVAGGPGPGWCSNIKVTNITERV